MGHKQMVVVQSFIVVTLMFNNDQWTESSSDQDAQGQGLCHKRLQTNKSNV